MLVLFGLTNQKRKYQVVWLKKQIIFLYNAKNYILHVLKPFCIDVNISNVPFARLFYFLVCTVLLNYIQTANEQKIKAVKYMYIVYTLWTRL